jgi:para-nitrobenzyl esterase
VTIKKVLSILLTIFLMGGFFLFSCTKQGDEETAEIAVLEPLSDPLKIDTGYITGTLIGDVDNPIRTYRGIPYAAPPEGDLRWKPPQPVSSWPGIRDCTQYSNSAPQSKDPRGIFNNIPLDEDCLYLNVITPAKNANEKLPVMVWFHPGAYSTNSGNDPLYNGHRLPQKGVILVTVNTRLGVLGLLAHRLLSAESSRNVSGNYMFLDMLASLEWVQKNITVFGGDPDNVTIFGQSGGGFKVVNLIASPLGKGLFKRGICQSGASAPCQPLSDLEKAGEEFFEKLGVSTLEKARKIPWEDIIKVNEAMNNQGIGWTPAIDGRFLTDSPANIFATGKQNPVQMMVGLNLGELGPKAFSAMVISEYVNILTGTRKAGSEGYAYIFDQVPINWRNKGGVAVHALDLLYIFGEYDSETSEMWSGLYELESFYGVGLEDKTPVLTDADKRASEGMMAVWAQFAKTGSPNVKGLINVPAWEPASDKYLYIADPLKVKSGFSIAATENIILNLSEDAGEQLLGQWTGEIGPINIVFRFEKRKNNFFGFIDSPDQGLIGIPITYADISDGTVIIKVGIIFREFKGQLSEDSIDGELIPMMGMKSPLVLTKERD